jgi:hypothetical protein
VSLLLVAVTETKPMETMEAGEADEPEAEGFEAEGAETEASMEAETLPEAEISKAEFPIEDSNTAIVCRHSCARLSMLSLDAMC